MASKGFFVSLSSFVNASASLWIELKRVLQLPTSYPCMQQWSCSNKLTYVVCQAEAEQKWALASVARRQSILRKRRGSASNDGCAFLGILSVSCRRRRLFGIRLWLGAARVLSDLAAGTSHLVSDRHYVACFASPRLQHFSWQQPPCLTRSVQRTRCGRHALCLRMSPAGLRVLLS